MNQRLNGLLAFDRDTAREMGGWGAGVDEAGRGPLAGPVVAAAVIFFRKISCTDLDDSKKLSPAKRRALFKEISRQAVVGIGRADEDEIDRLNIYQATRLAMKRAVLDLTRTPDFLMVDGKQKIDLPLPQKTIVKGDSRSASIAAASIIAKVHRDAWMVYLDALHPEYKFKSHKGYATQNHLKSIKAHGPSPVHRKSFSPIKDFFPHKQDSSKEMAG